MKFTKEQIDYTKRALDHCEVLTGGRGHSKTKEVIEDMQQEIENQNYIIDKQDRDITSLTKSKIKLKNMLKEKENIINEIKKGLDKFYKEHSRLMWTEEDYIEFINCIDRELKGSDKE